MDHIQEKLGNVIKTTAPGLTGDRIMHDEMEGGGGDMAVVAEDPIHHDDTIIDTIIGSVLHEDSESTRPNTRRRDVVFEKKDSRSSEHNDLRHIAGDESDESKGDREKEKTREDGEEHIEATSEEDDDEESQQHADGIFSSNKNRFSSGHNLENAAHKAAERVSQAKDVEKAKLVKLVSEKSKRVKDTKRIATEKLVKIGGWYDDEEATSLFVEKRRVEEEAKEHT
ncbi:hypothetical protein BGZ80_004516 [Entomortierella chlamydospora]|uniref:Uncharacterized protein n=1 Tax=Entomortierella chlamydospora TaxID=101097 RepID=A0A9P6SVV4_9FUNG|nr:hypothetical protein BGZ80_004516 [Entomortierella chlamydospora]